MTFYIIKWLNGGFILILRILHDVCIKVLVYMKLVIIGVFVIYCRQYSGIEDIIPTILYFVY